MGNDYYEPNPEWLRLPEPNEGDIVHLKHCDAFNHLVKIIVSSVSEDKVTGVIEAVFDWNSKFPITGGAILSLVGKGMTFPRDVMYNVIKKPDHLK